MFQKNETCTALEEFYLMGNIPKRNLASSRHLLEKVDETSWRTTRRNYKHIPHMVCIFQAFSHRITNIEGHENVLFVYCFPVLWKRK